MLLTAVGGCLSMQVERKGLYDPKTHRYGGQDAVAGKPSTDVFASSNTQQADMEVGFDGKH